MTMVQSVCNKVLWLEHGNVKALGPPETVVAAYLSAYQHADPQRG